MGAAATKDVEENSSSSSHYKQTPHMNVLCDASVTDHNL